MPSIEQGKNPADFGMCPHGNFPGSCPACSESNKPVEKQTTKPERAERPKIDHKFSQDVSREFIEWGQGLQQVGVDLEPEYRQLGSRLSDLGDPKNLEITRPEDIAVAFTEFHKITRYREQESESPDPEAMNTPERARLVRERFLETGAKLYPRERVSPAFLEAGFRGVVRNLEDNELLAAEVKSLPSESEFEQLQRENPQELLRKLRESSDSSSDSLHGFIQESMLEEARGEGPGYIEEEKYKQMIDSGARALYRLEQMIDALQAKVQPETQGQKTKAPNTEKDGATRNESVRAENADFTKTGPFRVLLREQPIEKSKDGITPEMTQLFLGQMLKDIDIGIAGARQYAQANPGKLVNRRTVGQFCGIGVSYGETQPIYQSMYYKATGRKLKPEEIHNLPMAEFLKAFGYNLANDPERSKALNELTNALM